MINIKMNFIAVILVACVAIAMGQDVIYDATSQPKCTLINRTRYSDCRWYAGLDMADQIIEKGRIIAYRIQWSSGWSTWFSPGLNDLDTKFNIDAFTCAGFPVKAKLLRRMWSYFYDHSHEFIICKPN